MEKFGGGDEWDDRAERDDVTSLSDVSSPIADGASLSDIAGLGDSGQSERVNRRQGPSRRIDLGRRAENGQGSLPEVQPPESQEERPLEGEGRPPEGDGQPPEGEQAGNYDPVAAATADYQKLTDVVQEFTRIVEQLRTELSEEAAARQVMHDQQLGVSDQVLSAVQQMQLEVAEMLRKGAGQDPGPGFSAAAHAASARGGTKYARKRWPGRLWDAAWDALRRMFPLLWSIIGHLVKVKEWTVGGQVGTGWFGFAQANISVTFG